MRLTSCVILLLVTLSKGDEYHPMPKHVGKSSSRLSSTVDDEQGMQYWMDEGMNGITKSLEAVTKSVNDHAKNVIVFVGDGMSIPTLTAARIFKAQRYNSNSDTSETENLTFETLDHLGHSKTYAIDKQVVDSAASANAMFSGVKTKYGTIGFDSHITRGYPETMDASNQVTTILANAQDAGMATGIVTTARLTHATPAGMYAHVFDRNWECDADYYQDEDLVAPDSTAKDNPPQGFNDIAYQLINNSPGNNAKVLMGGGYPAFFPESMADDLQNELGDYTENGFDCFRLDETDLTAKWLQEKGERARFVMKATDLRDVDVAETDYLFGLFGKSHLEYDHDRQNDRDPSLSEMVEKALGILQKDDNGFVLLVEGGRIDHAHHAVSAHYALDETVALDTAVETAMSILEESGMLDETLIVVTADHAHTMSISGYPPRGNDIVGLSNDKYDDELPFTTLSYANGNGYYVHNRPFNDTSVTRLDLTGVDVGSDWHFEYTSSGPLYSETHGGDDVAIFASGPGSFLFHSTHEQTHIYHVMAYSACVGEYLNYSPSNAICQMRAGTTPQDGGSSASKGVTNSFALVLLSAVLQMLHR